MKKIILIGAVIGLIGAGSGGAKADCPQFYPQGKVITVPNEIELCNSFYAVAFDQKLGGAIFSVEKFQPGDHPARTNDFHPDPRLDAKTRAEKSDYLHSGYDQGHLTPAADAVTEVEEHDTFLLSNMTPQEPTVNRLSWKMLEEQVRKISPDYVVTGAIYPADPKRIGKDSIPVPSGYYKIIWTGGIAKAWAANNVSHAPVLETTIDVIETVSGLKFPH